MKKDIAGTKTMRIDLGGIENEIQVHGIIGILFGVVMTVLWGNGVFEHSGGSRHGGGIGFGTAFAKKFFGIVGRAAVEDRIEKAMDV